MNRIDRPVVSVGNLSVGGTGKSPMVRWVVRELQAAGRSPCIAMRGYKAAPGREADEVLEHRTELPDVPVVVGPDRFERLREYFAADAGHGCDVVVLDDGFQHRRLARDLDLVLIDATCDVFADRLLPAGRLREPVESLARAHAVVITHAERATREVMERMKLGALAVAPRSVVAAARHVWSGLRVWRAGSEHEEGVSWLRGKRVIAASAIGNPAAFAAMIDDAGARRERTIACADHSTAIVKELARRIISADAIVMTEKDWSRIGAAGVPAGSVVARPRVAIEFLDGDDRVRSLLAGLFAAKGAT